MDEITKELNNGVNVTENKKNYKYCAVPIFQAINLYLTSHYANYYGVDNMKIKNRSRSESKKYLSNKIENNLKSGICWKLLSYFSFE